MTRTAILFVALVLSFPRRDIQAGDLLPLKHVVVFNNNGRVPPATRVYPMFRLSEPFAMVEDFYTPATLDATLTDNLARSRMLYIGQYCNEAPLFADADVCRAIRDLLQRGGVVFFGYNTGSHGIRFAPDTVKFLKSVGVTPPGAFQTGYGKTKFAPANVHVILSRPTSVGGKETGHYGWWEKWPPGQIVLAHDARDKGKATLVLQDKVLGKGAVMFNQAYGIFRSSDGVCFDVVRNLIAYAYGEGR
ncbi:MAG: hypothetical protein GXP25_23330 [Planctomycetes bacterium]|nr:hypothetical protein [Planctomycetota bacterium]